MGLFKFQKNHFGKAQKSTFFNKKTSNWNAENLETECQVGKGNQQLEMQIYVNLAFSNANWVVINSFIVVSENRPKYPPVFSAFKISTF